MCLVRALRLASNAGDGEARTLFEVLRPAHIRGYRRREASEGELGEAATDA